MYAAVSCDPFGNLQRAIQQRVQRTHARNPRVRASCRQLLAALSGSGSLDASARATQLVHLIKLSMQRALSDAGGLRHLGLAGYQAETARARSARKGYSLSPRQAQALFQTLARRPEV